LTVILLLYVFRYDVMSFLTNKSPISSSTPGGTESGVLPSLEGRCVVAEKVRRDAFWFCWVVWKAGTRKPGNVTVEAGEAAAARCRACLAVLGASIVVVVGGWMEDGPGNSRRRLRRLASSSSATDVAALKKDRERTG
jgi:hypothetical protein